MMGGSGVQAKEEGREGGREGGRERGCRWVRSSLASPCPLGRPPQFKVRRPLRRQGTYAGDANSRVRQVSASMAPAGAHGPWRALRSHVALRSPVGAGGFCAVTVRPPDAAVYPQQLPSLGSSARTLTVPPSGSAESWPWPFSMIF